MHLVVRQLIVVALLAGPARPEGSCERERDDLQRKMNDHAKFIESEIVQLATVGAGLLSAADRLRAAVNYLKDDPRSPPGDNEVLQQRTGKPTWDGNLQQLIRTHVAPGDSVEIKITPKRNIADMSASVEEIESCRNATETGIYRLRLPSGTMFHVLCQTQYANGGWTVIQHRIDGSESFYRDWHEYKMGFGSLEGEFWLGNEAVHQITAAKPYEMHVVLEDFDGNLAVAQYSAFQIASEAERYRLRSLGTYSGTAGDSLAFAVGQMFSTKDADNDASEDSNCAVQYSGGWWYNNCHDANLNGLYMGGQVAEQYHGMVMCWDTFKGLRYSLRKSGIMIREV